MHFRNTFTSQAVHLLCLVSLLVFLPLSLFAEDLTLSGQLEVLNIENEALDYQQVLYRLKTDDGTYTLLFPEGEQAGLKSGVQIEVTGEGVDGESGELVGLWVDSFQYLSVARAYLPITTSGSRSVLVLRVGFNDGSHVCTLDQVRDAVFGTGGIAEYFNSISGGALTLASDTSGDSQPDVIDVSINHSVSENCNDSFFQNMTAWTNAANTAAVGAGYNPNDYQHVFYYLPTATGAKVNCNWAGLAGFDCGSNCSAWSAYQCSTLDVMTHEFGHNIGLQHASYDTDGSKGFTTDSNGNFDNSQDSEYQDVSSIMGYGGLGERFLNAANFDYMGWIPDARMQTISEDGTYNIAALDTTSPSSLSPAPPSNVQYLRFDHSSSGQYFISFRNDVGGSFSDGLISPHENKVHVHFSDDEQSGFNGRTIQLAILDAGESYSIDGQFTVSQVALNSTYASVVVDLDAAGGSSGGGSSGGGSISNPTPTPTESPTATPTPTGDYLVQGALTFKGKIGNRLKQKVVSNKLELTLVNLETLEETPVTFNAEDYTFSSYVDSGAYELVATRLTTKWWKKKRMSVRPKAAQVLNIVEDTVGLTLKIRRRK